jgi:hypothetical protein
MKTLYAALLLIPGLAFAQTTTTPATTPATPAPAPAVQIKISLDSRGQDVREVLATLFAEAKKPYALDAAISGKLYIKIDAMPYEKALSIVLTQAGLLAKDRDGVVMITLAKETTTPVKTVLAAKSVVTPKVPAKAAEKPVEKTTDVTPATYNRKVTTRLTKATLADVFTAFGTQADVKIEIDPSVPAYRIDAFFVKTSLKYALNRVCKAAKLKYQAVDGKITISAA